MMLPRQRALINIYAALAHITLGNSFLISPSLICKGNARSALRATPATASTGTPLLVPPGILGPPEPLKSLKVGQHVNAFRALQYDDETDNIQFAIERVSHNPDVFHLRNFVTLSECTQIKSTAEESGMKEAETVTRDDTSSRKKCSVAWISSPHGEKGKKPSIISDLVASTANIFLSKDVMSHHSAGVEDLQVLNYGTGGEFVLHHDGEPRILTVIYYINGVGGTWFPLAHTGSESDTGGDDVCELKNKSQALDLAEGLEPGKDGLLVKGPAQKGNKYEENEHIAYINRGDAIAFYNYKDDGSAQLDWQSVHCGLPTTDEEGTKWIANHWYGLNVLAEY